MIDPKSNPTYYSFADSPSGGNSAGNSNAYLTQITYPPVNGVVHQENFTYNYATGELASSQDENKQTTSYTYSDSLNRLTQTNYPDGGKTTISYNDSTPSVTTSVLLSGSQWKTNISTMDGLGRVIQTQLADPSGPDIVDTVYDGEGHVYTQSNPHRSSSSPTDGTTTHYYDALGRQTKETEPDGNALQWCYNGTASTPAVANCNSRAGSVGTGTWVDSTDEVGNHWQRTSDSFGRLTEVMEPSGASQAPAMETDYAYDVLNNLLSVKQWGGTSGSSGRRYRSFTYDSLSRLLSASNPETGAVRYTYDANGNVQTKTDARGVATTYQYDALNRVWSKNYSNDPSSTPSSCYQYDSSTLGVGLLSNAWTQSASAGICAQAAPTTGFWTKRSILIYDAMGRIRNEQQFTPASRASGTSYAPVYTYDLAGNLTSSTDGVTPTPTPGTPLTFTHAYDEIGHLLTLTSNWIDSTHPATLFSAQTGQSSSTCSNSSTAAYAPFGGLGNATLGSGLTLNRAYDSRLRTTCETDIGTGVTAAMGGTATVTITGAEQSQ
jgi:YD repeat-containing protein